MPSRAKRSNVARARGVDAIGVRVGVGRKIDLRARHVQETERVALGERARFGGVHHVVRNAGDLVGDLGAGTQGGKGTQAQHAGDYLVGTRPCIPQRAALGHGRGLAQMCAA